jgi:nitroreductase
MDIYEAIRTRKSVRSFLDRPVEREKLQRILEAARLAPSACNNQEWRFVVVTDRERRKMLAAAAGQGFVGQAPVVLACCAETDGRLMPCGLQRFPIDVAIAIDHLTLAAAAKGLGTCWIGAFDPDRVREALGIPRSIQVVELLPLGYPADPRAIEKDRLPLDRIVRYEGWSV